MRTLLLILLGIQFGMSLVDFLLFGIDKRRAQTRQWRVPETTLLLAALFGGSLGGLLGMLVFHHKTRKPKFYLSIPLMLLVHAALAGWVATQI